MSVMDRYRLDGSPYPPGDEGLLEWARDLEDLRGRIVAQDLLWNGLWLSTVWLGLDHNFSRRGPPLIFESMGFNHLDGFPDTWDIWQERWATLDDAQVGHLYLKHYLGSWRFTLKLWWELIWKEISEC